MMMWDLIFIRNAYRVNSWICVSVQEEIKGNRNVVKKEKHYKFLWQKIMNNCFIFTSLPPPLFFFLIFDLQKGRTGFFVTAVILELLMGNGEQPAKFL